MTTATRLRSPLSVTLTVWKALFLREALSRVSKERSAWLWILLEPVIHIAFLMLLFSTLRVRYASGIESAVWIMVGLLAFFMFRRPAQQAMNAVAQNQQLYAYRQVKPVDTVLVRAMLEGFLMILIAIILFAGSALYGLIGIPDNALLVLEAFLGLWLLGLGYGLITSVASELMPELGQVIIMGVHPLYILSGVMLPLNVVSPPIREWLMLNPIAHGLEAARLGFASLYRAPPETSVGYLYGFAIVTVFFGLALHRHFVKRLASQ